MPMAERPKSSLLMSGLLKYMVCNKSSLASFEEFLSQYEKRGDISQIRESVAAYKEFFDNAVDTIAYDTDISPYTREGKAFVKDVYHMTVKFKDFLSNIGAYGKNHSKTWNDEFGRRLYKFVDEKIKVGTDDYATLPEFVDRGLRFIDELYAKPVLYESKPKKKPAAEEEPIMTSAGNVVAIVAVIALGFVTLNGLNNLQAASPAGAMPSLNTGFFLLPGGPFVSSLQMVLFMLASAVTVLYLAGKSLGEW